MSGMSDGSSLVGQAIKRTWPKQSQHRPDFMTSISGLRDLSVWAPFEVLGTSSWCERPGRSTARTRTRASQTEGHQGWLERCRMNWASLLRGCRKARNPSMGSPGLLGRRLLIYARWRRSSARSCQWDDRWHLTIPWSDGCGGDKTGHRNAGAVRSDADHPATAYILHTSQRRITGADERHDASALSDRLSQAKSPWSNLVDGLF